MEFTIGGRLEIRITPADVGKRVSVRRLLQDGPQGPKFTDTVGVLTSWDNGVVSVTPKSGESVRILESSLVAGKTITVRASPPARPGGLLR